MLSLAEELARPYGNNPILIEAIRRQVANYHLAKDAWDATERESDGRDALIACGIFADAESSLIASILAFNDPQGLSNRGSEPRSISVDGILYVAHPVPMSEISNDDGKPDFDLVITPIADVVVIPSLAA